MSTPAAPGVYDFPNTGSQFACEAGQTFSASVTYTDSSGALFNFTGMNIMFRLRSYPGTPAALTLSLGAGITNPSAGVLNITITSAQTQALVPTTATAPVPYLYELVAYDTATPPTVYPILTGKFPVNPSAGQYWSAT